MSDSTDSAKATEWRTMQVFLSPDVKGIWEVEVNVDSHDIRCSCPVFAARETCKHTKFVMARINNNNGTYPLMVLDDVTPQEAVAAQVNAETFRNFVLHKAKIEVL